VRAYLTGLVDELRRKGVEIRVIFREGKDHENFEVRGSRFLFPYRAFLDLCKIKPDVVHSQGTWYCLLAGVLYKKFHGCKLIHTFHTAPGSGLPRVFKWFFQHILDHCDCVTFVSMGLERTIKDVWGLNFKNTAITYAGVAV
jgi:hypothetical protein